MAFLGLKCGFGRFFFCVLIKDKNANFFKTTFCKLIPGFNFLPGQIKREKGCPRGGTPSAGVVFVYTNRILYVK